MSAVSASPTSVADRRAVLRRLLTVLVLAVCAVTVLLAVPDLRPVVQEVGTMNPVLVATAVGLELASCLGFVVIFRVFFAGLPKQAAREMGWIQMGSGALLPGGGAGSLAGIHRDDAPGRVTCQLPRVPVVHRIGFVSVTVMTLICYDGSDHAKRAIELNANNLVARIRLAAMDEVTNNPQQALTWLDRPELRPGV